MGASYLTQTVHSVLVNTVRIWVRIHDLPWKFLHTAWTIRILSHVGFVNEIENNGSGLPNQPYLQARIVVDVTLPLIHGYYLFLDEEHVVWVYFRYEGVYKFCTECCLVGHYTGRCTLSAYDARRIINRHMREFEESGVTVLQGQNKALLYTNLIRRT